jgi:hypothetical protein
VEDELSAPPMHCTAAKLKPTYRRLPFRSHSAGIKTIRPQKQMPTNEVGNMHGDPQC